MPQYFSDKETSWAGSGNNGVFGRIRTIPPRYSATAKSLRLFDACACNDCTAGRVMNRANGIQKGGNRNCGRETTSPKKANPIKTSKAVIEITVKITAAPTRQSSTHSFVTDGTRIWINHDTDVRHPPAGREVFTDFPAKRHTVNSTATVRFGAIRNVVCPRSAFPSCIPDWKHRWHRRPDDASRRSTVYNPLRKLSRRSPGR